MPAPSPAGSERTVRAAGARREHPPEPTVGELVRRLRTLAGAGEGLVALFDARAVAGERHVLSAWAHLGRARAHGVERLRDRGAELALFIAGDDQLPRALERVGMREDTETFVLVAERPRVLDELLVTLGLVAEPTAYPRAPTVETLDRLGIRRQEWEAVPPSAWEGLVLERVALVELSGPRPVESRHPGASSAHGQKTRARAPGAGHAGQEGGSSAQKH